MSFETTEPTPSGRIEGVLPQGVTHLYLNKDGSFTDQKKPEEPSTQEGRQLFAGITAFLSRLLPERLRKNNDEETAALIRSEQSSEQISLYIQGMRAEDPNFLTPRERSPTVAE